MRVGDLPILERSLDVEYMGQEALESFQQGNRGDLVPLYLRATQAEIDKQC
jgi:hypothetical protein